MQKTNANKTRNAAWEQYQLDKRYKFLTGIYLSAIALGLIFILVFANASQGVQQVLVAVIVMVALVALDAFKQCMGNSESNVFIGRYVIYDNRSTDNYHTVNYAGDVYHNSVEVVAELERIVNEEKESYLNTLSVETVAVLEDPDRKIIAEKAIERIEENPSFKQRMIAAMKAGGYQAIKQMLDDPIVNMMMPLIENWEEKEPNDRPSKLSQNGDRE